MAEELDKPEKPPKRIVQANALRKNGAAASPADGDEPVGHVCIHCQQSPDGTERESAYDGAWLHERCEKDFIQERLTQEGLVASGQPKPAPLAKHLIAVTLFTNEFADEKSDVKLTLPELAEFIGKKTSHNKKLLPWLKLAVFGENKSKAGCFRTNANMLEISGVEAEHDKGTLSFDDMKAALTKANIRCLLYTTPSYVPGTKERWRILAPLSQHHAPALREKFVARLNGALKGALGWESFGLSRAFIWGHVDGSVHRVEVLDGDFIDQREELDAEALFIDVDGNVSKDQPGGFYRNVNQAALDNLKAWVVELFPNARLTPGGAWRVSSEELNRTLEEDLSLHPDGITDWGIDDQDEFPKAGRYTAIDIVIAHGGAANAKQAAFWLCKQLDVTPESLGWDDTIERLARLPVLAYEQQRLEAAKTLKIRAKVLDGMVAAARKRNDLVDNSKIAEINADYALVLSGDKAAVMKFESTTKFRLLRVSAFTQWFSNQPVTIGQETIPAGDYWLDHQQRRQYHGIEFEPEQGRTGYYNLWQGFAVAPKAGDCSKFLAHVRDNAARGDDATYKWIVGWWAQIVKHPTVKMETALVIRGPFGTGKTKIGKVFGSLFGDHYLLVASPRYITGQFNAHMKALLVLHADEAFWAGDKKSEGTLRDLVTGDRHMLEYKGIDPISLKNFVRLYVTGNPDWVVPAGFAERRWAVFDMGEGAMQNHEYFAAIDKEMDNGGREALLQYLLDFDLKQVDLRVIPKTAALLHQQIESMTPIEAWWLDLLTSGNLPYPMGPGICTKEALHKHYVEHAKVQGVSHRSSETQLGMFLHKQLGLHLKSARLRAEDVRFKYRALPPLAKCRKLFAENLGQPIDWGLELDEWQGPLNFDPNEWDIY